ncbi:hypothetical protein ADS78_12975, partial [Idiomarina abyssalis]
AQCPMTSVQNKSLITCVQNISPTTSAQQIHMRLAKSNIVNKDVFDVGCDKTLNVSPFVIFAEVFILDHHIFSLHQHQFQENYMT